MKKLVLCLVFVLYLVGCGINQEVNVVIKNDTDILQSVNLFSSLNDELVCCFSIAPLETVVKTIPKGFYKEIATEKQFDKSYNFSFEDDTWVIKDSKRIVYTIKSELEFDITVQNFNIVNGEKSSPCYSVFIPNNSSVNVATIDVYPEWLGNIWDLENRNIDSVNDYNDTLFQSVKHNGVDVYYEIIKTDRTINIRYRKG